MTFDAAVEDQIFQLTPRAGAGAHRVSLVDGRVLIVSGFEAKGYRAVFAQVLTSLVAEVETPEERLQRLKMEVFRGEKLFEQSVAGQLGHVKRKQPQSSLEEAVDFYFDSYAPDESTDHRRRLRSPTGREYVRLFLTRWFH